jgi:hypothetical protein
MDCSEGDSCALPFPVMYLLYESWTGNMPVIIWYSLSEWFFCKSYSFFVFNYIMSFLWHNFWALYITINNLWVLGAFLTNMSTTVCMDPKITLYCTGNIQKVLHSYPTQKTVLFNYLYVLYWMNYSSMEDFSGELIFILNNNNLIWEMGWWMFLTLMIYSLGIFILDVL